MNLGLITQKLHILGILGTHVPVHLGPVPVQVAFCWLVPIQVGPVPVQVGLWWAVPIPVHPREFAQNCFFFPLLVPFHFIQIL